MASPSWSSSTIAAQESRKALVVGAGPVGCLTALALAKRGWHVDLLEGRTGECVARYVWEVAHIDVVIRFAPSVIESSRPAALD